MPDVEASLKKCDHFFFRKATDEALKEDPKNKVDESGEAVVRCSDCGRVFPKHLIVRCYDCGKPYCIGCAGPGWIGVCPDCEEVFEAEEDYWSWR